MEVNALSINMIRILNVLKKKWFIVVILAVVCGFGSYYYTSNFVPKQYRASVRMYVYNEETTYTVNGQTYTQEITASDLSFRTLVINDCLVAVTLPDVIDEVNTNLKNAGFSTKISAGNISTEAEGSTRFFDIYLTAGNPDLCNEAIELLADASLEKIEDLLRVDNVRAVAFNKAGGPISPNVTSSATSGTFIGVVIAMAIIALIAISDRTIKNEEEFNEMFPEVAVIGSIPEFSLSAEKAAAAKGRKTSMRYGGGSGSLPADLNSFKMGN